MLGVCDNKNTWSYKQAQFISKLSLDFQLNVSLYFIFNQNQLHTPTSARPFTSYSHSLLDVFGLICNRDMILLVLNHIEFHKLIIQ